MSKHLSPTGEDILEVRLVSLIHSFFLQLQISMRPPTPINSQVLSSNKPVATNTNALQVLKGPLSVATRKENIPSCLPQKNKKKERKREKGKAG